MHPYHPANFKLVPYAPWRIMVLAWIAKALDVHFHVHGIPFGGCYRPERNGCSERDNAALSR